jgi:lactose/L-arabinose transport system ATP-binding protein
MVFQNYALYPHMTVAANMGFSLKLRGAPKSEINERVRNAADILGLAPLLDRYPRQLSGGQRQRVAIGRAIVRDPKVFLFDEPLSNLDAELRVQMRVEIAKLHKMLGNTTIYVTHDQTEALTMADRIVVLRAGGVEQIGAPLKLYDDPDNEFVAGFIGSPRMNFFSAKALGGGRFSTAGAEINLPLKTTLEAGASLRLGIRPEHLESAEGIPLEVSVDVVEQLGSTSFLYGTTANGEPIIAERRLSQPQSSSRVTLRFTATNARLFGSDGTRIR